MALQIRTQHRRNRFNLLSQLQCRAIQVLLADLFSNQIDLQHGKVIGGHFLYEWLFGCVWHLCSRGIDSLAHVTQCFIQILRDIKFNKETSHPLGCGRSQLNDALKLSQLDLHRLYQKALGIFGRDTLMIYPYIKKR